MLLDPSMTDTCKPAADDDTSKDEEDILDVHYLEQHLGYLLLMDEQVRETRNSQQEDDAYLESRG